MNEINKKHMFEQLFASTQIDTKFGLPLKVLRRLLWPFINASQFYLLHQITDLADRVENLEKTQINLQGLNMTSGNIVEKFLLLNTDYIALKRSYMDLNEKYSELKLIVKANEK